MQRDTFSARAKAIVVMEIVARVVKDFVRFSMRETKDVLPSAHLRVALQYFNVVFGAGDVSNRFWEVFVTLGARYKFPDLFPSSLAAWKHIRDEPMEDISETARGLRQLRSLQALRDSRTFISMSNLVQAIQTATGAILSPAANNRYMDAGPGSPLLEVANPFEIEDVDRLAMSTKVAYCAPQEILQELKDATWTDTNIDEPPSVALERALKYASTAADVFGPDSTEAVAAGSVVVDAFEACGQVQEACDEATKGLRVLERQQFADDALSAAQFRVGSLLLASNQPAAAVRVLERALHTLDRVHGKAMHMRHTRGVMAERFGKHMNVHVYQGNLMSVKILVTLAEALWCVADLSSPATRTQLNRK